MLGSRMLPYQVDGCKVEFLVFSDTYSSVPNTYKEDRHRCPAQSSSFLFDKASVYDFLDDRRYCICDDTIPFRSKVHVVEVVHSVFCISLYKWIGKINKNIFHCHSISVERSLSTSVPLMGLWFFYL